jgi:hypothetical protein
MQSQKATQKKCPKHKWITILNPENQIRLNKQTKILELNTYILAVTQNQETLETNIYIPGRKKSLQLWTDGQGPILKANLTKGLAATWDSRRSIKEEEKTFCVL